MKNENGLKKTINQIKERPLSILIICLIIVILILGIYSAFFKSNKNIESLENQESVTKQDEQLLLGEEKYLEFLWMVDGAFNNQRYNNETIKVNGKEMSKQSSFTCTYDEEEKTCHGTNFIENYNNVFASNVNLDSVYGDGAARAWYKISDGEYYFMNSNSCEAGRMSLDQNLKVVNSSEDKITYQITYDEELKEGIYKGKHHFEKDFVLVYENNKWKVSKAYFHDPCYQDYIIE